MLDTTGKLYERILCNRIEEAMIREKTALAENQYGFRRGRSTVDAIGRVMSEIAVTGAGTLRQIQLCVLITIDVANAFNSAPWWAIMQAMINKKVPEYLVRVMRNYLCDREIIHGKGHDAMKLTSRVPQGSVLGPLLWSIMYDSLLTTRMAEGITLVGYADDVAIVGRARTVDQLEGIVS
jgi:hypothetical protein